MAGETAFKSGKHANFTEPVTLTMTSDDLENYIVVKVTSTFTYILNLVEIRLKQILT